MYLYRRVFVMVFQSSGTLPCYSEAAKISWRAGATSDAASLRNLEGKLSGPDALCGFKPWNTFVTPSMPIVNSGTSG